MPWFKRKDEQPKKPAQEQAIYETTVGGVTASVRNESLNVVVTLSGNSADKETVSDMLSNMVLQKSLTSVQTSGDSVRFEKFVVNTQSPLNSVSVDDVVGALASLASKAPDAEALHALQRYKDAQRNEGKELRTEQSRQRAVEPYAAKATEIALKLLEEKGVPMDDPKEQQAVKERFDTEFLKVKEKMDRAERHRRGY